MKTLIKNIVFLIFTVTTLCHAQKKETIYIKYDDERSIPDTEDVGFYVSPNFFNIGSKGESFVYNKSKNTKQKIPIAKIKDKLITKEQANKKFISFLKEVSKKIKAPKERQMYFNAMMDMPDFSGAFDKIYIYHIQTETLYEVDWISFIE